MKKIILSAIFLFELSCSTSSITPSYSAKFNDVFSLQPGISTEADVQKILGSPQDRQEQDGQYTLNYKDPQTGHHRASLNFRSDKILAGFIWIPADGESEITADGAKARFENSKFIKSTTNLSNAHVPSIADDYTDEKKGIMIRSVGKWVEAIVKFDPSQRLPADSSKKSKADKK